MGTIEPLSHGNKSDRGRSGGNNPLFVEAVLWIVRTGGPWGDLPAHFGHWNTAYSRHSDWEGWTFRADVRRAAG
ncbi:transposase [Endosaccharibacter trunci]|uniref:transposase n=1 Tax=Endosaccharibacter trunci TaxID=2812733 RepID=UPI003BF48556